MPDDVARVRGFIAATPAAPGKKTAHTVLARMTTRELISQAYAAFNRRDVDAALMLMSEDVNWPKASEGGRVVGKRDIREYWTRQWVEFDPRVDVLEVVEHEAGVTDVKVRQLVKDMKGEVLSDTELSHVYVIANGLIDRMDVKEGGISSEGPSAAFSASSHEK